MQAQQYPATALRGLLGRIDAAAMPMLSIMNWPPLACLARLQGLSVAGLARCSVEAGVWAGLTPDRITLASPAPQAFRPEPADPTHLEVSLSDNFKICPSRPLPPTALLAKLAGDIEAARAPPNPVPKPL